MKTFFFFRHTFWDTIYGEMTFGLRRFFFDAQGAEIMIELDHTVALRVGHLLFLNFINKVNKQANPQHNKS
jgi:hypothetical protein